MAINHSLDMLRVRPITKRRVGRCGALFSVLLAGAWSAGSRADTPPPARAASTDMEEITVTATRREQSADTVPISITAFSQAVMDEQGIKTIDDVSRFTPGLTFAPSQAGYISDIAIRGVRSEVGASTTGIYIDETPVQVRSKGVVTQNSYPQIFDLERVEVLKGPQGTLFGTGSMGGTVRFITPEPDLHNTPPMRAPRAAPPTAAIRTTSSERRQGVRSSMGRSVQGQRLLSTQRRIRRSPAVRQRRRDREEHQLLKYHRGACRRQMGACR